MVDFEKKKNTDQISSLTSERTRKKRKLSTFAAFIDFKKTYDFTNRDMLWFQFQRLVFLVKC